MGRCAWLLLVRGFLDSPRGRDVHREALQGALGVEIGSEPVEIRPERAGRNLLGFGSAGTMSASLNLTRHWVGASFLGEFWLDTCIGSPQVQDGWREALGGRVLEFD